MSKNSDGFYGDLLSAGGAEPGGVRSKLVKRAQLVEDRYSARDAILDQVEPYYWDVGIERQGADSDVYEVRVNDGQTAANMICDLLAAREVHVNVASESEKPKAKGMANDTEAWLDAWLETTEREEDVLLTHELAMDGVMRGAVVMRVLMLEERIPEKREGKEDSERMKEFPLVPEIRDYRYVYPVYQRTRLVEVFERYEAVAGDVRIDWPELDVPGQWKDDDAVTVWEWWSGEEKAFWVTGGTMAEIDGSAELEEGVLWLMPPTKHGYGVLPYSIRAIRPQSKRRLDPERMAAGLMQEWVGTLKVMNLMESAKVTAVMAYTNAAWVVWSNRSEAELDLDLTHGAINYLLPEQNEKIESLVKGDLPLDLMEVSGQWQDRFHRASVPAALYGEQMGANVAGYAISIMGESGRRVMIPVANAVTRCLADVCNIGLSISKELLGPTLKERGYNMEIMVTQRGMDKKMVVHGVELDWKKVDSNVYCEVVIGDPMPADDERNMNLAVAARQPDGTGKPLLSDETIRVDILKLSDNRKELMRILKERLTTETAAKVAERIAIEAGLIPDPEEVAMQEREEQMRQEKNMMAAQQPQGPDPQTMQMLEAVMQRLEMMEGALSGPPPGMAAPPPGAGGMPLPPGVGGPPPGMMPPEQMAPPPGMDPGMAPGGTPSMPPGMEQIIAQVAGEGGGLPLPPDEEMIQP